MSIKRFVSALLTGALCLGVLTACGSAQKPASSGVSADAQRYGVLTVNLLTFCSERPSFI